MRFAWIWIFVLVACSAPTPMHVEFIAPSTGELGMIACSTTPLTNCDARMLFRHSTRVHPRVNVTAATSCPTLEADARRACRASTGVVSGEALRCLAERGVFLDLAANDEAVDDAYRGGRFVMGCEQGEASVDMIEPW